MSEAEAAAADPTAQPATFPVVVFADFVCPYSFLAVEQIDRIAREHDVRPLWRPHWLHPATPPEGTPRKRDPADEERRHAWFREMAPELYPKMRFPEKRHYSFHAFEALEFALDRGLDFEYKTAVYDLLWTEGRDIGDIDTLVEAAARAGLDAQEMHNALVDRVYAERALAAVVQAHDLGITNTPTIFIGKARINGWTYDEVLEQVLEQQGFKPKAALAGTA
jgi:predicted DsbA family dithiol-disulfide isomerase